MKRPTFTDEGPECKSEYKTGQHWSYDVNTVAPIRFAAKGIASEAGCPATTVPRLFQKAVETSGSNPALRIEQPCPPFNAEEKKAAPSAPFDNWKTWTYKQYYDETSLVARAFLSLGLQRKDAVCIYGFNSPEWVMAEQGGIMAGGIAAGIYPSDTPQQVIFKAKHSSASIAVCQQGKDTIFENAVRAGRLPNLKAIVVWGADQPTADILCPGRQTVRKISWNNLAEFGNLTAESVLDEIIARTEPGEVCAYIYTSGTTGTSHSLFFVFIWYCFECFVYFNTYTYTYILFADELSLFCCNNHYHHYSSYTFLRFFNLIFKLIYS